jgi:hypothetical protein
LVPPLNATPLIVIAVEPTLVKMKSFVSPVVANERDDVLAENGRAVPVNGTLTPAPLGLKLTDERLVKSKLPVVVPATVGVNAIEIRHVAPAARVHFCCCAMNDLVVKPVETLNSS